MLFDDATQFTSVTDENTPTTEKQQDEDLKPSL
jgi:hypothetical protein